MKESTEKILLAFVKSQTDFNKKIDKNFEKQEAFNKNIMNELKEIKRDIRDIKNTPTMRRELSNN